VVADARRADGADPGACLIMQATAGLTTKRIRVASHDGNWFSAYLALPPRLPAPGIVMVAEIFGVNPPLRMCADDFAGRGYAVLAPDMFWRMERDVELGYDKESYQRAYAFHKAFDYEIGVRDATSAIEALRAMPECTGKVGLTGFCLGGTFAYLAAARCPVEAAAGYYGTRIQNFLADAPKISKPLIQHFGEKDHTTPPEILGPVLDAVRHNPNVTSYVYKDAGHAFANPGRPETYIESVATLAHARTFELFNRTLAQ